jgi:leucyl aminopeptidase
MSASSPSNPVGSPLLEVDTYGGTLSTLKTPSAAELNVQFYSKEREKVSKALEKAKKALENAELALLNSRSHCFRLHPSRYEEVKTAKLRVRQEERNVQDTKKDKKEREKVMDKMQHEWNLKYGAVELSSANKVNKLVHTLSTTSPSAMDPWESKLSNANSRPEGLRERVAEY